MISTEWLIACNDCAIPRIQLIVKLCVCPLSNGTMTKAVQWSLVNGHYVYLPRNAPGLQLFETRLLFAVTGYFVFGNSFDEKIILQRSFDGRHLYKPTNKFMSYYACGYCYMVLSRCAAQYKSVTVEKLQWWFALTISKNNTINMLPFGA